MRAGTGGEPPKSPIHLDFVEWWLYLLSTVPPLLFFTVATVLVACWTKVWIDSNELAESWVKAVRIACGVANALLYSANALYIVAAYAVWPAPDGVAPQQIVPLWLYVAAFALVSFGCLLVGWVIHRELSKVPIRLAIRVRKVRQIFVVTFVTFACFFARAIAVAVLAATPAEAPPGGPVTDAAAWRELVGPAAICRTAVARFSSVFIAFLLFIILLIYSSFSSRYVEIREEE